MFARKEKTFFVGCFQTIWDQTFIFLFAFFSQKYVELKEKQNLQIIRKMLLNQSLGSELMVLE